MSAILPTLYILTVAAMSVYGVMGLLTAWLYWRHRHDQFPCPTVDDADLPAVTVQLPIFNERFVVERLIQTAVSLDYPRDRLQIQVVDDSTDDTTAKAAVCVRRYQAQGVNIQLVHRNHQHGYKAGALSHALASTEGAYVAIFDADFLPPANFLRQTIPHFLTNPHLGLIQGRWGHLNPDDSPLTAAQAIAMDKHFAMDQTVRFRANLFPKFNGTAGVWRRSCMESVGGWHDDTVCEDLCLSTRAVLHGWQFRMLNDVVAPAELPNTITAFKNQQGRWAKGATQCLLKFGWQILRDRHHSLLARFYALVSLSAYIHHLLMIMLLLLQIPLLLLNYRFSPGMLLFSLVGLGQPLLFVLAQRVLHPNWRQRLRHFPTLLVLAVGLSANNGRSVLQAIFGHTHPFIRTPKGRGTDATHYFLGFDNIVWVELFLLLYALFGLLLALWQQNLGPMFLLLSCILGFGTTALLSLREAKVQRLVMEEGIGHATDYL
ncbi:MAG: glycosyltransferase [Anaerolineales bacterium]|nr:glycosyltransferase [Anaerolineales bacterium]